jgi:hypothetical protein
MRTFMEEQKASRALSSVTALLLLDGQRRVPFFDQTHDSVRSAVKLLGLAERPNRLLNATKLVAFSVLLSPIVVWLIWAGCGVAGLNQCTSVAEAIFLPALFAWIASMALAGVLYSLSIT